MATSACWATKGYTSCDRKTQNTLALCDAHQLSILGEVRYPEPATDAYLAHCD